MLSVRLLGIALGGIGLSLLARPVAAQEDNEQWDGGFGQKAERRSDVVVGVSTGMVLGTARGYPNEVDKLDDPDFESTTGFQLGASGMGWLGGAFTDWFTFGVGYAQLYGEGSEGTGSGGAFLFHVETFPFYTLGGALRDLTIHGNFGAGGYTVDGDLPDDADGGFVSFVGFGSAYEAFRFGHFALGPNVDYLNLRSPTLSAHQLIVGARVVFYGGPG
jgi:hypothetical protein